MEAERDVVRDLGPRQLLERARRRGRAGTTFPAAVQHDREQHALVLVLGVRGGDEHRLAREAARPRAQTARPRCTVALDDPVQPAARRPDAPHVAVGALVAAAVVDPRQLDRLVEQPLARHLAGGRARPGSAPGAAPVTGLPARSRSR